MGPVAGCLVENASRSDLKSVAHQPDIIYMVSLHVLYFKLFGANIMGNNCRSVAYWKG
jgi:hypothetical protein